MYVWVVCVYGQWYGQCMCMCIVCMYCKYVYECMGSVCVQCVWVVYSVCVVAVCRVSGVSLLCECVVLCVVLVLRWSVSLVCRWRVESVSLVCCCWLGQRVSGCQLFAVSVLLVCVSLVSVLWGLDQRVCQCVAVCCRVSVCRCCVSLVLGQLVVSCQLVCRWCA